MKIAVVAPEHPGTDKYGGVARYLRAYLPALGGRQSVTLISIEEGEPMPGVHQEVIAPCPLPSPAAPPWNSRHIQPILQTLQPDVVEYASWWGLGCLDNGPWAKVVRLTTPVMHGTLRPGIMPRMARPLHHRWELNTVKNADLWISSTAENLRICKEAYALDKPSAVIPHGVDLPVEEAPRERNDVLFVGRFEARKGLDVLLQAWADVCNDAGYDGQELHLVGRDMPGVSGSYLQDCIKSARPIPEGSINVHAELTDGQLDALRGSCGIAVIPSRYESFGMVGLEAFAAGHAVVASRTGGLQEVVEDGSSGLMFENENVDSLSRSLLRVMNDSGLKRRLAVGGREALVERFSVGQMVDKSIAAYEKAVELAKRRFGGQAGSGTARR